MSFQFRGLDPTAFQPLFHLSDEELAARGARRVWADQDDAYPCRVSLLSVDKGEELLLLHHAHQVNPSSPYRAGGPIFVSRSAKQPAIYRNEFPSAVDRSLLSLRAYDSDDFIVDADVGLGSEARAVIDRFFANPQVAYIDAHFARRGCFAARIERS
jgi:hypothetical protein